MMRLPMMNERKPGRDVRSPEQQDADWLRKACYEAWRGNEEEAEPSSHDEELTEDELDEVLATAIDPEPVPRQLAPLRLHPCGEARRPCPRTECRLHINHDEDKRRDGPHTGPETCTLDMIQQAPNEELTLEEIGNVLGLTRERVRQIEAEAMRKLARKTDMRQLVGELVGRRKTA